MKQENIVGIWLGKFEDEKSLHQYISDKNGRSGFEKDINFPALDEDFYEAEFHATPIDYKNIIDKHSFTGYFKLEFLSLVSKLKNKEEYNAILLIFGQKSPFGNAHLRLFNYKNKDIKKAPISFLGTVRFTII